MGRRLLGALLLLVCVHGLVYALEDGATVCSGNGELVGGQCACFHGFGGEVCELEATVALEDDEESSDDGSFVEDDAATELEEAAEGSTSETPKGYTDLSSGNKSPTQVSAPGDMSLDEQPPPGFSDLSKKDTHSTAGLRGSDAGLHRPCPDDCGHHGSCVNGECLCQHGFGGANCAVSLTLGAGSSQAGQDESPAKPAGCANDCHGNGVCTDGRCFCKNGFSGDDCSIGVDCAKDLNNCNGHGACDGGVCVCEPAFGGADCSQVHPLNGIVETGINTPDGHVEDASDKLPTPTDVEKAQAPTPSVSSETMTAPPQGKGASDNRSPPAKTLEGDVTKGKKDESATNAKEDKSTEDAAQKKVVAGAASQVKDSGISPVKSDVKNQVAEAGVDAAERNVGDATSVSSPQPSSDANAKLVASMKIPDAPIKNDSPPEAPKASAVKKPENTGDVVTRDVADSAGSAAAAVSGANAAKQADDAKKDDDASNKSEGEASDLRKGEENKDSSTSDQNNRADGTKTTTDDGVKGSQPNSDDSNNASAEQKGKADMAEVKLAKAVDVNPPSGVSNPPWPQPPMHMTPGNGIPAPGAMPNGQKPQAIEDSVASAVGKVATPAAASMGKAAAGVNDKADPATGMPEDKAQVHDVNANVAGLSANDQAALAIIDKQEVAKVEAVNREEEVEEEKRAPAPVTAPVKASSASPSVAPQAFIKKSTPQGQALGSDLTMESSTVINSSPLAASAAPGGANVVDTVAKASSASAGQGPYNVEGNWLHRMTAKTADAIISFATEDDKKSRDDGKSKFYGFFLFQMSLMGVVILASILYMPVALGLPVIPFLRKTGTKLKDQKHIGKIVNKIPLGKKKHQEDVVVATHDEEGAYE